MWVPGGSFFVVGGDGLSGGRAALGQACGQGVCMFVSDAVVSPGHTKCLWLLSCRAPHNSPGTLDACLAQTDGVHSAAGGRRVPSRQEPQALSMTSGLLQRTGPDHAASCPWPVPGGSLSTRQSWVLGACGLCSLTVGCGPSALRWMAAKAEFVGV